MFISHLLQCMSHQDFQHGGHCQLIQPDQQGVINVADQYNVLLLLLLLSRFSRVRLCATPQTAAHKAPLSPGFSRQEHWSGLPFPSPMHDSEKGKCSHSVMSDSQRPHGLQPARLLHPWEFPGKTNGVGCHCLLYFLVQLALLLLILWTLYLVNYLSVIQSFGQRFKLLHNCTHLICQQNNS